MGRFTLSELFFAFMAGVIVAAMSLMLVLLYRNCVCGVGKEPSDHELRTILHILAIPVTAWVVGLVVSILKDRYG